MDARYLWMHQKRVQGSHFANLLQAAQANQLMLERRLDPCMSEVFPWEHIPAAHMQMWKQRAQARQHGRARQRPHHRPQDLRGRAGGEPQALRVRSLLPLPIFLQNGESICVSSQACFSTHKRSS